jgi:hypothetical protein
VRTPAAIDRQGNPCDPSGVVGQKKGNCVGDSIGSAQAKKVSLF